MSLFHHILKIKKKLGRHCGIFFENATFCAKIGCNKVLLVQFQARYPIRFAGLRLYQFHDVKLSFHGATKY